MAYTTPKTYTPVETTSFPGFCELPHELQAKVLYEYLDEPWTAEYVEGRGHQVSLSRSPFLVSKPFRVWAVMGLLAANRGTLLCKQSAIGTREQQWFDEGISAVKFPKLDIRPTWDDEITALKHQFVNLREVDGGGDLGFYLRLHYIPWNRKDIAVWHQLTTPAAGSSILDVLEGRKNQELMQWAKQAWQKHIQDFPFLQQHDKLKFRFISSCPIQCWDYKRSVMAETFVRAVILCMEFEVNQYEASLGSMWLEGYVESKRTKIERTPEDFAVRLRCLELGPESLALDIAVREERTDLGEQL